MYGSTIHDTIVKYIPKTLLRSVKLPADMIFENEEEMVQVILSNSDNMLRMYGTSQELLLNLKKFQNFPLSHRRFGFHFKDAYTAIAIMYSNMDGIPFVNKADAFCLFQKIIDSNRFESAESFRLFYSMQAILLKSHEEKILGICEFFKYDKDLLSKLQDEFLQFHQKFLAQESSTIHEDWTFEKALEMFKSVLPVWNQREYPGFENDLKAFFDSKSGNFNDVSVVLRSFANFWKTYISVNPEMFLPYDKQKNPNCPIVVRVFEDHGVQFVMKSELFNAINIRNPNSKRLECKEVNGKLMTMSYEKVQRKYKDRIGNIEFIKYPIQRAGHKAVPIMTPSGGHCILAMDFLFEFLKELIFTHRIFQKTDCKHKLRRFLLRYNEFFSPHHKSIFFVTLEKQCFEGDKLMFFWRDYENIPYKCVRNVGEDGFTVQDLKEELEYLGLTETFPDIQDFVDTVYSGVFNAKKEEFMRTCDMFKALHLFLHTQNACHLFPDVNCDFCVSSNQNQLNNASWKEPHFKKIFCTCHQSDPENTYLYEVDLLDGTKLTNSYFMFFNMEQIRKNNIKYFLYDTQDLMHFTKNLQHLKPRRLRDECRYSLDAFQKVYPEKKIYIRTISSMIKFREETKRVFTEEVLDMIPVVLRKQNTPIEENDDRLTKYRRKWETNNKDLETTISLTEFWYILEEFDIDRTEITIIPDPVYEITMQKMINDLRRRSFNVIGPCGEQMMRFEQAVFHIFEVVVCSVNWTMDSCKKHEGCLKELKDRIIFSMRAYSGMKEGTYVTVEHVESTIVQLKNHCSFKLQSNTPSPLVELQNLKIDDKISKETFISNCHKFGLTKIGSNMKVMEPLTMAFVVRIHYLSAWRNEFFDFQTLELYHMILDETEFRSFSLSQTLDLDDEPSFRADDKKTIATAAEKETPKKTHMEDSRTSKKSVKIAVEKLANLTIEKRLEAKNKDEVIQRTTPDDIQKPSMLVEALELEKPTSESIQKTPASEKVSEVEASSPEADQKTPVLENALVVDPPTSDVNQKKNQLEKLPVIDMNQSKNCAKCSRTSEMCNEAKKALKLTQNKLEKYEKKAKRTDEVEKELKALKLETKKKEKEAERRELEMGKKQKMIEELELKVSRLEANETRMRLNEKNHSIHEKEQSELIDELTTQLENQNEKIQLMELELQRNEESLKLEIRQKERGFEELRAVISIMSTEMESIQRDNRNLQEQIASIPEAPPTPTVPEYPSEEQPNHHRFALFRFQRIKDSLCHKKQLGQAKEMVEKMKSSSNLVEIHQIAEYEYYQFEGKLLKYVKEVELSIQRIKENCDVSTVNPLPDSPEFSHRFVNLYWRIINNQSITSTEIEVPDSECFICYVEMTSDQETLQCEECKKVTHFECASKWLKIHRSCPHCRREMLNPEEFPDLGQ
ncbi:unnamed protein product [Caenorhabditis nigoni]